MFRYSIVFEAPSGPVTFPVEGRMEIGRQDDGREIMVRCGTVMQGTGEFDQSVSRFSRGYLLLYLEAGRLMVQDCGTLGGTCMDGRLLPGLVPRSKTRRQSQTVPVEWNCCLTIGATTFRVLTREILMAPPQWIDRLGPEHIRELENLSAQALVLLAGTPEQARCLTEIAKTKLICEANLSVDRILALQLSDRPELAETVKEVLTAVLNTGKREDYERLIKEIKENAGARNEIYEKNIRDLTALFAQAMETMKIVGSR
ncbi:MAG: hypothetical protein HY673_04960 [Chloroflexi bacterium]|nr:hypothetical protein [Chloroflexota bacterium]